MEAQAPPQHHEREIRDEPARRFPRPIIWWGDLGAVRRLLEFEFQDRRVGSSACALVWGCCAVIHGTAVLNRRDNPEHLLAGYALFTAGAGLMYLALGGAGGGPLGRAAARVEEAIGGYLYL